MNQTTVESSSMDSALGRRRAPREAPPRIHCFQMQHAGGVAIGALLDYTSDGFGIETYEPLEVGTQVTLSGNVEVGGLWRKVQGKAYIVRCESNGEGCYRLGLSGADFGWRSTINPDSPLLQRPPRYSSV